MNKFFSVIALLCMLCAASHTTVMAQIPRQISFQGVLSDGAGNLLPNGPHNLSVSLYTNASGGAPIFSESFISVPVINGIFNLLIGSVSPLPGTVAFDRAYYVEVSVDGGTPLSPRTPMVSAPYALRAGVADALAPGVTGVVTNVNGAEGALLIQGGGGTTVNTAGNVITISSSGGGGTGIQGVQNSDGTMLISNANGPVATINLANGGITNAKLADDAVTTAKLADNAVTAAKIGSGAASNGQVLTANGAGSAAWLNPPGLTLPFSSTVNSGTDLFAVTNSGVARAGYFRNSNAAATASALYGESNHASASTTVAGVEGKSTNGFGVIGRGGANSSGIFGLVITGASGGAFYAGTGVTGFSDNGHGVGGITYQATSAGVYGTATGTGTGVKGNSSAGIPGWFENTTAANANNALEGRTNGAGNGIYGLNSATTGSTSGILGEAASTANGIGANGGVSGVLGRVTPTSPGGYSAGVRGVNNGTTGTGIGVIGYQAGSGWGVYGETPSGFGVYGLTTNSSAASSGVRGETFSTNGIAVEAKYSGTGVGIALEVDNGAIRVAGTNKAAFVHTATAANKLSANGTDITNPMCDGDANAVLFVTQKLNPSGIVYNNSPIGVYYNTVRNKWEIFNENNVAIPNNAQFNVLVIKQ